MRLSLKTALALVVSVGLAACESATTVEPQLAPQFS